MARSRSSTRKLDDLAEGVHLRGEIGEVWVSGRKAGLVYRWALVGWIAKWRVDAERYKLDPFFFQGGHRSVELRLHMRVGTVTARGTIWTEYVADNRTHRAMVVKGDILQWQKKEPVVPPKCS